MSVNRRLTGFRLVEIQHGETPQQLAARVLSDASRWADLIAINDLAPPYFTGDPSQAGPKVKLYGQNVIVPAATAEISADANPDHVFGTDLDLRKGGLSAADGDLLLVRGRPNLKQALLHRVVTGLGELMFHQTYGCGAGRLIGTSNGPTAGQLAAKYVESAVAADPRVSEVNSVTADVVGDVIKVIASATPIVGAPVDLNASI